MGLNTCGNSRGIPPGGASGSETKSQQVAAPGTSHSLALERLVYIKRLGEIDGTGVRAPLTP